MTDKETLERRMDEMLGREPSPASQVRSGFTAAYRKVTCADCGREYTCLPHDDYYHRPPIIEAGAQTLTNGVCETCLLGGRRLLNVDPRLS